MADSVPAIATSRFSGEEAGSAAVLFGDVSPAGRLPVLLLDLDGHLRPAFNSLAALGPITNPGSSSSPTSTTPDTTRRSSAGPDPARHESGQTELKM